MGWLVTPKISQALSVNRHNKAGLTADEITELLGKLYQRWAMVMHRGRRQTPQEFRQKLAAKHRNDQSWKSSVIYCVQLHFINASFPGRFLTEADREVFSREILDAVFFSRNEDLDQLRAVITFRQPVAA